MIAVKAADIPIGKAAESARKSLTCAAKPGRERISRYACILAGGQDPIGNGQIAVVQYQAQWDPKGTPIRVGIENILGVSADLKRIPIANVDAVIEIRKTASTSEPSPK